MALHEDAECCHSVSPIFAFKQNNEEKCQSDKWNALKCYQTKRQTDTSIDSGQTDSGMDGLA